MEVFVRERGEATAGGGVAVQLLEGGGKNWTRLVRHRYTFTSPRRES